MTDIALHNQIGARKPSRLRRLANGCKRALPSLIILGALAALQIWNPAPVQALRMKVFDLYQKSVPAPLAADRTLIVDIDDASLTEIGQWPWDRATIARLVAGIAAGKPQVIGLDIVFPEQDRLSPRALERRLSPNADATWLAGLPDTDETLAHTLKQAPTVAAIAAAPVKGPNPLPSAPIARLGQSPLQFLSAFTGAVASLPEISSSAKGSGNITIEPGIDGVVRQIPLLLTADGNILPSLSLEMYRVAIGAKSTIVKTTAIGVTEVIIGDRAIPLDGTGRAWIRYTHHDGTRFISARDILSGATNPEIFKDRRVILGSSAFGLWDLRAIPLGYSMPGVEIQAQLLDNIANDDLLERPYWMVGIETLITILSGLALILFLRAIGARWTLTALAFLVALLVFGSFRVFASRGLFLDAAYPAFAITMLYLSLVHAGHASAEAARELVTGAFKKYLSPVLVERLAHGKGKLNLGGEIRELTLLFADIKGFTPLSERLKNQPQRLTKLVNLLLDRMSEAVLENGGTIDKFMGDNVMAFWNAPLEDPDHAAKACRAALDMQKALHTLNAEIAADPEWADITAEGLRLEAGIGINTGPCVVGNFGSRHRFDYSAIGDTVNLASRLEGAAKRYNCVALVTASTVAKAPGFAFESLGSIPVRGRNEQIEAFTLAYA